MRKEVGLGDTTLFELSIGKRVLKKDVFGSAGSIPLFSANVQTPFGYVKQSNLADFSRDYMLWGIDGNFSISIKKRGEVFATTDHCGAIKILHDGILPEYLIREFTVRRNELGYDRSLRSNIANVKQLNVSIPVDSRGNFDIEEQRRLAGDYDRLSRMLKPIKATQDSLRGVVLAFDPPTGRQVRVDVVFDMVRGTAKYTHKFMRQHKGDYPVYSSQTERQGIIGSIATYDYDKECLTWTMDGELAGSMFYRKAHKFNMTDHCGALFVKPEYAGKVDLEYVLYDLHPKLRGRVVGARRGRVKMNVMGATLVDFPTDKSGKPELNEQREIAERRRKAYEAKDEMLASIEELTNVAVEF